MRCCSPTLNPNQTRHNFLDCDCLIFIDTPVISSGNYSTGKYEMDSLNLDCSASSADNIFWFYRPPGNDSEWEPYKFSWCSELSPKTCHLDDNDKRLRIGSVSMEMNDAQFICVASCSTTLRNATAFIYLGVQGISFLIFCDN